MYSNVTMETTPNTCEMRCDRTHADTQAQIVGPKTGEFSLHDFHLRHRLSNPGCTEERSTLWSDGFVDRGEEKGRRRGVSFKIAIVKSKVFCEEKWNSSHSLWVFP